MNPIPVGIPLFPYAAVVEDKYSQLIHYTYTRMPNEEPIVSIGAKYRG